MGDVRQETEETGDGRLERLETGDRRDWRHERLETGDRRRDTGYGRREAGDSRD